MPPSGKVCVFCTHLQVRVPARKNKDIYLWRQWTCFKLLDLSQSPEKFGEILLKGMYLLRHLVPSLFLQPSLLLYVNPNTKFLFFSRLQNFRDFRRSSGSIVSLWTKGGSPWESWRNGRFFGAYNWLKNGPGMKMSTLSYWKRGCSSCLPYPSLLLTKRVSQSPMISEILKDLESDVTEVPWVFPRTAGCWRKSPRHHQDALKTVFEVTRDPNKKKPTHLPRGFFFFFRIRGGSKWIHFQLRWVHYFVCLCGFSVGDLLLETWDSDEKKVWDQFVNLDFAKCKKIILWRRQSYLLNALGCSLTQWPPGLLKHSWGDHGYQLDTKPSLAECHHHWQGIWRITKGLVSSYQLGWSFSSPRWL